MNKKNNNFKEREGGDIGEDERDLFLYKASHDLKGPLASIMGITTIAKSEVTDLTALKYFTLIEQSTKRLDITISDLLQYTRINKSKTEITEINFSKLTEDILSSLKHLAGFEQVDFRKNIKQEKFYSDLIILNSILQNLVDNAIKYRRKTVQSYIKVDIEADDKQAKIIIEDNGTGIEKDLQEKIFNMFFRATTESSGSGLGLYIVKSALSRLGGSISLKSELNQGTTFIVNIPNNINFAKSKNSI